MQLTLKEKEVWDIVEETWAVTNTNEYWKNRATAAQIIKEEVDNNLFKSIWDIKDSHNIWETLKKVCSQVEQRVIYAVL